MKTENVTKAHVVNGFSGGFVVIWKVVPPGRSAPVQSSSIRSSKRLVAPLMPPFEGGRGKNRQTEKNRGKRIFRAESTESFSARSYF